VNFWTVVSKNMSEIPISPFSTPRKWDGILAGLVGVAVYFASVVGEREGIGTVAAAFITAILIVVAMSRPLYRKLPFYLAIGGIALSNLLILAAFPWSNAAGWTGVTFIPFTFADLLVNLLIIYLAFRVSYGRPSKLVSETKDQRNYADR
jgi:hypothetical protein